MSEGKKSREQVEREQMTRRQALRKFGFGAGLSAIMLLSADDLARMVGDRLRQMESDNKVADQIAKELQSAGVALAAGSSGAQGPITGPCTAFINNPTQANCEACEKERYDYCMNTAHCAAFMCSQAANCASSVCSNIPPTYAGLQTCWRPAVACLATAN